MRCTTLVSDMLWNQFIKKHYGKTSHYLVPRSVSKQIYKKTNCVSELPNVFKRLESDPISADMECIRGYRNKDSRKWVSSKIKRNLNHKIQLRKDESRTQKKRKYKKRKEETLSSAQRQRIDTYDQLDEMDIEFETGGKDNKRISYSEFRQKQILHKVCKNKISIM